MNKDPRIRDVWQKRSFKSLLSTSQRDAVVIVGYSDDEGVRNNNGRAGAKFGPERILHYLGKLVLHSPQPKIFVLSDSIPKVSLKKRHEIAESRLYELFKRSYRVLTLGGGHDYAYPDASAFFRSTSSKVLNIDAHLDVREVAKAINSGTAFRRFSERFGGRHIIQWGLQAQCNSSENIRWAKDQKMKCLSYLKPWPKLSPATGLSICLDAFAGIRGVSAPSFIGPSPSVGIEIVRYYSKQTRWAGIYESAPKLDPLTEDSARLGALLAYHFIYRGRIDEGNFFQ